MLTLSTGRGFRLSKPTAKIHPRGAVCWFQWFVIKKTLLNCRQLIHLCVGIFNQLLVETLAVACFQYEFRRFNFLFVCLLATKAIVCLKVNGSCNLLLLLGSNNTAYNYSISVCCFLFVTFFFLCTLLRIFFFLISVLF